MAVSVIGLIINGIMFLIILALIITGLVYNGQLQECETKQSPYCYTMQCPCDDETQGPCFGYTKMPAGKPGQWYCSNAPLTIVNTDGSLA